MKLATEIITEQREKIDSKRLDRIIRSEYSTDTVAATINSITDNYSDMLKECVPEDKLDEMGSFFFCQSLKIHIYPVHIHSLGFLDQHINDMLS